MKVTLRGIVKSFLDCVTLTNAEGTVENYRRYLNSFAKSVKGKNLSELRAVDLLKWGRKWHQIQAVQRLFNWACGEAQLITKNPFKGVKKPPLGMRKRIISRKTFLLICRDSERRFRDFLVALRETIARPQEVRSLCWEHLKSERPSDSIYQSLPGGRASFVLEHYKSRERRADPTRPRIIVVSKRLARLLLRLAMGKKDLAGPVFVNTKGKAWTSNAVRLRMRNLRIRLKLKPDHRDEPIVAYTIRHTGATNAAAKGMRDRVLAEIMGHTSTRTTARYQHLEIAHLREAMDKLEKDK